MFRAEDQCSRPVPGNQAIEGAAQLRRLTPQPAIQEVALGGIEKGGGQGKMRVIVEEGAGGGVQQAKFGEEKAGILCHGGLDAGRAGFLAADMKDDLGQ